MKGAFFYFLLLAFAGSAMAWSFMGYSSTCIYTRADAVKCFERHVDTNHDGLITVPEAEAARDKYTGKLLKALSWLVSWKIDIRTSQVIKDCGYDAHKGGFTAGGFMRAHKTCVASHAGLCLIKKVCDDADAEDEAMRTAKPPSSWSKWL